MQRNGIYSKVREVGMIIVQVKEGELIDRPLKRFKRKFDRTGTMREIRRRTAYTKPSVRRREEILHARYVQRMQDEDRNN